MNLTEQKLREAIKSGIKTINEAEKYITDKFKVGDKIKTGFGEWEVIETDYAPNKSFIAPFIFKGKDMERVNIPNPPKTNKKAVGYKVTDGDKYPIIGFLYQYKDITKLVTVGVDESVVTEAAYDSATRNELAQYIINLSNELVSAKSHNNKKEIKYLEKDIAEVKAALDKKKNESVVTEDFPGKGETVKAKDLNHEMLDYFNRMNISLSINTKSKKNIKGSVGTMFNDLVFNGGDIDKKDIVSVKIIESVLNEAKSYNLDTQTDAEYDKIIGDAVRKLDGIKQYHKMAQDGGRTAAGSTSSQVTITQYGKTDNTDDLRKILKKIDSNLLVNTIKNNFDATDNERSGNDKSKDIWKYTIDKKINYQDADKLGLLKFGDGNVTDMDHEVVMSLMDMMAAYTSEATPLADIQWRTLKDFMSAASDYIKGSAWKKFQKDVEKRYPILENKITEMKGVKHYTKDGKEWTGATHKMPNGTLMTQDPHNKDSEELFHIEDLKKKKKKGLWDNVHAKRKRGEKPAKKGDDDYPDEEAWKDAQESVTNEHGGEAGMAKSDLFKISNYGQEIHDMLSGDENLPEWLEAKITKAADYLGSVKHYLEYEIKTGQTFEYGGSEWSEITSLQNYLTIDLDKFENGLKDSKHKATYKKARKQFMSVVSDVAFEHSKLHENKLLKQDSLSPAEYQKAKKLKGFDPANYLWDKKQELHLIRKMSEGKLNEGAIDIFTKDMNDEGTTADIFDAVGDGKTVNGQFTKKKWDDGVPVTKHLSRGGYNDIKTPKGKFQIIETPTFWYYEINKGWAAINKSKYGTPPFEY